MRIGAVLRDVSMTPTVTAALRNHGVVVAVTVTVIVAIGGSCSCNCNCGEDCVCKVGWGEGVSGFCDLRGDRRGFYDSGGKGGWCCREWYVG